MFERFTDRARRVLVLAQEEARLLGHPYIGTEHLLLALIHERQGVAARALESMGIELDAAREKVDETANIARGAAIGSPPFTTRAKKVLELSLREALRLNHNYIGTEHLLLGLVEEGEGHGAQVLVLLGADLDRVRETVLGLMSQTGREVPEPEPQPVRQRLVHLGGPKETSCSFCGRDLWEAGRYVSAGRSVICADCVALASELLAETPAEVGRGVSFPRVYSATSQTMMPSGPLRNRSGWCSVGEQEARGCSRASSKTKRSSVPHLKTPVGERWRDQSGGELIAFGS